MSSQPGEATTFAELVVIHASDHGAATGSADARGWRPAMEDAVVVSRDAVPGAGLGRGYVLAAPHRREQRELGEHALDQPQHDGVARAVREDELLEPVRLVADARDRVVGRAQHLAQELRDYLTAPRWYQSLGDDLPASVVAAMDGAWDITRGGAFPYWRSYSADMPGRDGLDPGASYDAAKKT